MATLVVNKLRGASLKRCSRCERPLGLARIGARAMLEDIAVLTTGTMIAEDLGIKLENGGPFRMLGGKAKRVRIEKENTTIIDRAGSKKDIEAARIAQIKERRSRRPPRPTMTRRSCRSRLAKARRRRRGDPRWRFDRGRG